METKQQGENFVKWIPQRTDLIASSVISSLSMLNAHLKLSFVSHRTLDLLKTWFYHITTSTMTITIELQSNYLDHITSRLDYSHNRIPLKNHSLNETTTKAWSILGIAGSSQILKLTMLMAGSGMRSIKHAQYWKPWNSLTLSMSNSNGLRKKTGATSTVRFTTSHFIQKDVLLQTMATSHLTWKGLTRTRIVTLLRLLQFSQLTTVMKTRLVMSFMMLIGLMTTIGNLIGLVLANLI